MKIRTFAFAVGTILLIATWGAQHVRIATIPSYSGIHVIGHVQGDSFWYELQADDPPNHVRSCNDDFCPPERTVIIFE